MPIVYFIILLGPLVFFHELGHFLVARWMGVRVLSFSIGFGPVVTSWHKNGTEYALRAFPLGGFVKMLGDDPTAEVVDQPMADDAFTAKPVWKRSLIVAAGPIANFILPFVILFSGSLITDAQVVSGRIGTVLPGGPAAAAGLQNGDRITAVDGVPIHNFMDLVREISARPGKRSVVEFERDGARETVRVTPTAKRLRDRRLPELGLEQTVGRIQVMPDGQSAIISVRPGTPAFAAGLRSGDLLKRVNGRDIRHFYELKPLLQATKRQSLVLDVIGVRDTKPVPRKKLRAAMDELHSGPMREVVLSLPADRSVDSLGMTAAQTVVGVVEAGSPADVDMQLIPGDEILEIDGVRLNNYFELLETLRRPFDDTRADPQHRGKSSDELVALLRDALARPRRVKVRRGAQVREVQLRLVVKVDKSERPYLVFGASEVQRYERPELVQNHDRIGYAWRRSVLGMTDQIRAVTFAVIGLFRGHLSIKNMGGPIFMAQVAAKTSEHGWGYLFNLMVWLSINLAILNLLPIPLVDGGQLMFLAIEAVKREPVSLRVRIIASYIGLCFLGLLFVVVTTNDVQRWIMDKLGG